jgi:hypothetical protein
MSFEIDNANATKAELQRGVHQLPDVEYSPRPPLDERHKVRRALGRVPRRSDDVRQNVTDNGPRIGDERMDAEHGATVAHVTRRLVEDTVERVDVQSSQDVLERRLVEALAHVRPGQVCRTPIEYLVVGAAAQTVRLSDDTVQRHKLVDPEVVEVRRTRLRHEERRRVAEDVRRRYATTPEFNVPVVPGRVVRSGDVELLDAVAIEAVVDDDLRRLVEVQLAAEHVHFARDGMPNGFDAYVPERINLQRQRNTACTRANRSVFWRVNRKSDSVFYLDSVRPRHLPEVQDFQKS